MNMALIRKKYEFLYHMNEVLLQTFSCFYDVFNSETRALLTLLKKSAPAKFVICLDEVLVQTHP